MNHSNVPPAHSNIVERSSLIVALVFLLLHALRFCIAAVLSLFEPILTAVLTMAALIFLFSAAVTSVIAMPHPPVAGFVMLGVGCAIASAAYSALVRWLS